MRFKENKKYLLYNCEGTSFYVQYKKHQFYLMENDRYIFQYGFHKIRVLYKERQIENNLEASSKSRGKVVLLLMFIEEVGGIYDLLNEEWMLRELWFTDYRKVEDTRYVYDNSDTGKWTLKLPQKITDYVFEFINIHPFRLINFSVERGIILDLKDRPQFFDFGYLINNNTIHYFDGQENDISKYELIEENDGPYPVYHDVVNDDYYVLVDVCGGGLYYLEPTASKKLSCLIEPTRYSCDFKIIYDKTNNIMTTENITNDNYEWTDEDSWDAMTDGQYGDYSGSYWEFEDLGY